MDRKETLRLATPLIAMGTVWVARKGFDVSYRTATGEDAPAPDDLDRPLTSVLIYAVGTSMVAAVVSVLVNRALTRAARGDELPAV